MKVVNSSGEYAFLMESNSIQYQIERNCDLIQVDRPGNWILTGVIFALASRWGNFWTQRVTGSPSPPAPSTGFPYPVPSYNCRWNKLAIGKTIGLENWPQIVSLTFENAWAGHLFRTLSTTNIWTLSLSGSRETACSEESVVETTEGRRKVWCECFLSSLFFLSN